MIIGYCRTSTKQQEISLDLQETKIKQYALLSDIENIKFITDQASGKSFKRKGIETILNLIKEKKVSTIIIYKLDRLTRNISDLNNFIELCNKKNIALVSIKDSLDTKTASGRLVINLLATVSQWERETISERTSEALQQKKINKTRYTNNAPFGFSFKNNKMIENKVEKEALKIMKELKKAGLSYRKIAEELQIRGIKNRKNTAYNFTFIGKILRKAI
jgi:DNA invertase Pin-like site-specific DNA recombinase